LISPEIGQLDDDPISWMGTHTVQQQTVATYLRPWWGSSPKSRGQWTCRG